MTKNISRLLIANRGEIALRIKRACENLKITPICVVSDPDKESFFARSFNEVIPIGGAAASESYLVIEKILEAAKKADAQAVHPGYGFLSENATFAKAVRDAGFIFIGPSAESIDLLGDKTKARAAVQAVGVPCVPGSKGGLSDQELEKEAMRIGLPIIIKAAAGGGGRGMRIVYRPEEMKESLERARGEAKKFFNNADVFIERYIEDPRHIEVQLFGDSTGKILHLGTRDCSLQRRHQKIIEEAPAPNLSSELREKIHGAAVNAAKCAKYENAGTAEFLVSGKEFFFLEMNTRIQVEHPVTEEITGLDLVSLQIKVAQGEPIPFSQKEVTFRGHAIECRICAEDPKNNFAPSLGRFALQNTAQNMREEKGFDTGDTISPYYDSMVSKVIVKGENRLQAMNRMKVALQNYKIQGVQSNILFLQWLLQQKPFREGCADIKYVERIFSPEKLDEFSKEIEVDPAFQSKQDGEVIETKIYESIAFKKSYTVQIVHRKDKTFLSVPFLGERAPKSIYCRRSNSLQTAFDALVEEVLEIVEPNEIFYNAKDAKVKEVE